MFKLRDAPIITAVVAAICISAYIAWLSLLPTPYPTTGWVTFATEDAYAELKSISEIEEMFGVKANPLTGSFLILASNSEDSYAKLKCFYREDFDNIWQFSFEYSRIAGDLTPYGIIELDRDGDGFRDFWVVQEATEAESNFPKWVVYDLNSWRTGPGIYRTPEEIQNIVDGEVLCVKVSVRGWNNNPHIYLINKVTVNGEVLFETL